MDFALLGLADPSPRKIKKTDTVSVKCFECGTIRLSVFHNIMNNYRKRGFGFRCSDCKKRLLSEVKKGKGVGESRNDTRALKSGELLKSYGLKDITSRRISSVERVEVVCACGKEGIALFNNLRATFKRYGCSWRCHECACNAISRSREGRFLGEDNPFFGKTHSEESKIKAAANYIRWLQTEEGKAFLVRHAEQERARMLSTPNAMEDPVLRTKAISRSNGSNNKVMSRFKEMLKNRGFEFDMNLSLSTLSSEFPELKKLIKNWDFVIYKDKKPVVVVDIDGLFYHGHTCDPFFKAQMSAWRDSHRMNNLPGGIKVLIVDEDKIEDGFRELLKVFDLDYDSWINTLYEECLSTPFPYPEYSDKRMMDDWKNLKRMTQYIKGAYPCNSIVTHFHKSIYSSRKNGQPSPVEAWRDPELLKKLVLNRFIYKSRLSSYSIARGFETSYISPRVSVFQPGLARQLLSGHAPGSKTCVDPFAGFSGRLLGSASLDMTYTGYEIREECVQESNEIIKFLKLTKARVVHVDSLTVKDDHLYDVLLTCPPYGNKEIWGDVDCPHTTDYYVKKCLDNFKAKTYIFVVDEPGVFADYVVDVLDNKSHMTSSKEKILVMSPPIT